MTVKDVLKVVHDMKMMTELVRDISDHYLVLFKITLVGAWRERMKGDRRVERVERSIYQSKKKETDA